MGKIWRISGPLVIGEGMKGSQVYEIVEIGSEGLVGEVIGLEEDKAIIQSHEDTLELKVGETIRGTGTILTAELGPGIVGSIYDGLQKSLTVLMEKDSFIKRGAKVFALPRDKKWQFSPKVKVGDKVSGGDIIGIVPETHLLEHRVMVPVGMKGVVKEIRKGEFTIEEPVARLETNGEVKELTMMQRWPVRKPRPYRQRLAPSRLLITGMRIIDYMFPLALGGKAAIPGGLVPGKLLPCSSLPDGLRPSSIFTLAVVKEATRWLMCFIASDSLRTRPRADYYRRRRYLSLIPLICPWWLVKPASLSALPWLNTSGIWVTTCCWWLTQLQGGLRR